MAETGLVQIIEGALLAAGRPLTVPQLADLFEEHERPENPAIREALKEVAERCEDRGFELQEVASGFRFQVRQSLSPWVARLWQERPQKYSRALLETLALIAYRQPITRGEIEEIRGVAVSSNIIKTLHEREWIRVVGHRDVPGRPAMYATTRQFLDYFNLKSLDQLPALAEIRDLETLNAELGFSEPVPAQEGAPGLTVVGGTDHNPEGAATEAGEETEPQLEQPGQAEVAEQPEPEAEQAVAPDTGPEAEVAARSVEEESEEEVGGLEEATSLDLATVAARFADSAVEETPARETQASSEEQDDGITPDDAESETRA
jgi:segregation and condensation protein B